jgi:hypothetical protein
MRDISSEFAELWLMTVNSLCAIALDFPRYHNGVLVIPSNNEHCTPSSQQSDGGQEAIEIRNGGGLAIRSSR